MKRVHRSVLQRPIVVFARGLGIAEIIMRTYYESQGKQVYLVRDTINLSGDK